MRVLAEAEHRIARWTGRVRRLPILVLFPHSRCNCRCVMCDIWKANADRRELTVDTLRAHLEGLRRMRVERVVLSGGEPLMHSNLWRLCAVIRELGADITLLSTGLLVERHAAPIAEHCDELIFSLDGPPEVHDRIRRVPGAFDKLRAGASALAGASPRPRLAARCVVQRDNFRRLADTVETARTLGLDRISFLAVDSSSSAFNRPRPWSAERASEVALSPAEVVELAEVVEDLVASHAADFASGFVEESPAKLRRLVGHFRAVCGGGPYPGVRCNAPWVSAVVEADGKVRPCFFHPPYGDLTREPLVEIVTGAEAARFRRGLDVGSDPVCRRCVCSLWLAPGAAAR